MKNQLQIFYINILNSNYKFLFNLLVSLLIYACFKESFIYTVFCTTEEIPLTAEPKMPILKGIETKTPIQTEVSAFLNQAGVISEQEELIRKQNMEIQELKRERDLFEEAKNKAEADCQKKKERLSLVAKVFDREVKKAYAAGGRDKGHLVLGFVGVVLVAVAFLQK